MNAILITLLGGIMPGVLVAIVALILLIMLAASLLIQK